MTTSTQKMPSHERIAALAKELNGPEWPDSIPLTLVKEELRLEYAKLNKSKVLSVGMIGTSGNGKSSLTNSLIKLQLSTIGLGAGTTGVATEFIHSDSQNITLELQYKQKEEFLEIIEEMLTRCNEFQSPDGEVDCDMNLVNQTNSILQKYVKKDSLVSIKTMLTECIKTKKWCYGLEAEDIHVQLMDAKFLDEVESCFGKIENLPTKNDIKTVREMITNNATEVKKKKTETANANWWEILEIIRVKIPTIPPTLALVDIPGSNDSNFIRARVYKQCLKRLDHMVIVLDITRYLSDPSAATFLHEIKTVTMNDNRPYHEIVSFVITKLDTADLEQLEKDCDETYQHFIAESFRINNLYHNMNQEFADKVNIYANGREKYDASSNISSFLTKLSLDTMAERNARGQSVLNHCEHMLNSHLCPNPQGVDLKELKRTVKLMKRFVDDSNISIVSSTQCIQQLQIPTVPLTQESTLKSINHNSMRKIGTKSGDWTFKYDKTTVVSNFNTEITIAAFDKTVLQYWETIFKNIKSAVAEFNAQIQCSISQEFNNLEIIQKHACENLNYETSKVLRSIDDCKSQTMAKISSAISESLSESYHLIGQESGKGMKQRMMQQLRPSLDQVSDTVKLSMQDILQNSVDETQKCKQTVHRILDSMIDRVVNPDHIRAVDARSLLHAIQQFI